MSRAPEPPGCEAAAERLLEAEPAELRGEARSPLARHLRACAACREVAATILDAQARLARELDALLPSLDLEAASDLAARGPPVRTPSAGDRDRRRFRKAILPLAAAAAAATGLWLAGLPSSPTEPGPPASSTTGLPGVIAPGRGPGSRFALHLEPRRDALVFATRDPTITVVWLYPEDRGDGGGPGRRTR